MKENREKLIHLWISRQLCRSLDILAAQKTVEKRGEIVTRADVMREAFERLVTSEGVVDGQQEVEAASVVA